MVLISYSIRFIRFFLTQQRGKSTEEEYNVEKTREILELKHYGLEEVKERILEWVAVMAVQQRMLGKILCFVGEKTRFVIFVFDLGLMLIITSGPPGVGKTSIAASIAEALGRSFVRFSVGGLNRVSEIKGHRRTYVASMPGQRLPRIHIYDLFCF